MTHKKLPISPELILSHYWAASAKPRLAVMYQSLNTLLDKIGNPEIKPNDFTIIERLLNSCARWFSLNISRAIIERTKKYQNLNFEDLTFLIALSYSYGVEMDPLYVEDMIEKYFSRKITGISEDDSLFTQLTSNTNGLLVCREQAVKLIALISGITEDKAHLLVRNLRLALGWLLYQIEYLKTYYSYVMNGEIESFEKSYDITPIIDTIKQKHNITSF